MKTRSENLFATNVMRTMMLAGLILLLAPVMLSAAGTAEADKPYGMVLSDEFVSVISSVESGDMSVSDAMAALQTVRQDFGRVDNEDYARMEQLLNAIQTQEMTMLQAREQFYQLEESQEGMTASQIRQRERVMTREEDGNGEMVEKNVRENDDNEPSAPVAEPDEDGPDRDTDSKN